MKRINDGGPVFPVTWTNDSDLNATAPNGMVIAPGETVELQGMTLRQFAAIKLRVPESGDQWLDDMIRKAQRDELAAKAMQGFLSGHISHHGHERHWPCADMAGDAYAVADAMLAAREGKS